MHGEFCIVYFGIGFLACYIMEVLVSLVTLIVKRAFYYRQRRRYGRLLAKYCDEQVERIKNFLQNRIEDDKL